MKLESIVIYEKNFDKFNIEHCRITKWTQSKKSNQNRPKGIACNRTGKNRLDTDPRLQPLIPNQKKNREISPNL